MKRKSLLGLLLVGILAIAFVFGAMIIGTQAEETKIVFAVGDLTVEELGVEGATYTADIMGALSVLDENSRKHASDLVAEIHFKGNTTGGDQGNLLFAQKTIWREDGTKLPISIIGHDTDSPRDAYIYLDGIGGWYTCANDYTFVNLTLPVGDQVTYFYAGSGNVRMDNVKLLSGGEITIATVADRTAQYMNAKAAAEYVVKDVAGIIKPDVSRLPCGDAWYTIRTSEEYMATGTVYEDANGEKYVDKDLTGSDGSLYGDYSHAGNTGGGQYLNACVYYEAILGLDCRENDWTPTSYVLDAGLQKILQEAAHAAVLEVYGEDHFKNPVPYERQGDGVVNLLMMGSSSSFYMRDELHFMAEHMGIKFRVVHAYSSGIKMSTQWAWTRDGNGKWTVYTEWNGKTTEKKDQKMTDFVALWDWDAIVTYETGGSFGPKKVGYGYNENTIAESIKFVDKADEFINYVYDYNTNNANARYFWFNTVGAPVGAPGPSDSAEGFVFADNNTTAAYAGWTQADLERYSENGKVVSSITLGEGMSFGSRVNAVGYMLTAPESPFTDETAAEVKFIDLAGFETELDVRPVNTLAKLILDADTAATDMIPIKRGYSPASAEFHVKKGSAGDVQVYGYSANSSGKNTYGDVTVRWTGGLIAKIDLLYGVHLTGDLNLIIDPPEGTTFTTGMIRMAFGSAQITGDVSFYAKNCTMASFYGGGNLGEGIVSNTMTGCNVSGDYFGVRVGSAAKVYNTITDSTIGGMYCGGHWSGDSTVVGPIVNNIDGLVLTGSLGESASGTYYGGSSTGGSKYSAKVNAGSIDVGGKTETLSVYNNIKSIELAAGFYGGSRGGTCNGVRNDIESIKGTTFYGAGGASGTYGNATTNIKTAVLTGNFYGGASSSNSGNATENINIDIGSITLGGNYYGGNLQSKVSGTIKNVLRGGTITGAFYGGSADKTAKNVTNEIYGGTFNGAFYGGNAAENNDAITNTVNAGTFNGAFYGGTAGGTSAGVTNNINGGNFVLGFAGANYSGTVNGDVVNNVNGGNFLAFNGAFLEVSARPIVTGDVLNTVKGPVVVSKTFSGGGGGSNKSFLPKVAGTIVNVFDENEKGEAPVVGSPASETTAFGYYGGGHHVQACQGIVNHIKAGTFKKIWMGGGQYQGYLEEDTSFVADANTPAGVEKGKYCFINIFEGGTFESTQDNRNYVWGGTIGFNSSYKHGALLGGVYSEVSGDPVFEMRFIGGHRGYATNENQPTTVKISGGTFNNDVFMFSSQLGTGNCSKVHTGNATITGGTFNKAVYGGTNGSGSVTNGTLTVKGGIFNGALTAGSLTPSTGSFALTLEPCEADIVLKKAVAARNDSETVALKGGDKKLVLASNAAITASSYDGTALNLHSGAGWTKGATYLTLPTAEYNANITAAKEAGAGGDLKMVVNGAETKWIGMDSASIYGVNLILDQKIGLRLWLNKAEVDAIGNDFTYAITCDGKTLAGGTYSDLTAKAEVKKQGETDYYTLVLGGLEPAAFHKAITFEGDGLDSAIYSINDILSIVITNKNSAFGEGFVTLAKSLWNYGIEAYDRFSGKTSELAKETISAPADAEIIASATDGTFADAKIAGRALVLREAVGLRIYLNLQNGVKAEDLTFILNGTELGEELLQIREENGNGYNASVTLYVSAKAMDRILNVSITKGDEKVGSYSDSIASICQQYRTANGVDADLCTAILRYIQAVPGMND